MESNPAKKIFETRRQSTVEIASLSPEEQEKIREMESRTDILWADRKELDYAYEKLEKYLPRTEHEVDGRQFSRALTWKEMQDLQAEGKLSGAVENATRVLLEGQFSGEILERKVRNVSGMAKRLIERGLMVYDEVLKRDNLEERIAQYKKAATEGEKRAIWAAISPEAKMLTRFRRFRLRQLALDKKALRKAEEKIEQCQWDRENAFDDGGLEAVEDANERYEEAMKEYEKILYSSPEIYYWRSLKQLEEWKDVLDDRGNIVETPYVKEKIAKLTAILDGGQPAFIHGELGSGKTELAKLLSRKKYSQKHVERWEKNNPRPEFPGEMDAWEARREGEKEPLIISGHKNMDVTTILGGRGIEAGEMPSPEEQVKKIEEAIAKFEKEQRAIGNEATEEGKNELRIAYQNSFKNFVEVKEVLGLFYQAMKEGRPLILDEMNAMPHSILIGLNEYLKAKPGDIIVPMIAGAKPFPVQEGFVVIATGNWKPEDGKMYVGRQQIDAAFLSRFGVVHYDYLPQRIKGETQETTDENKRAEKAEGELFILLATHVIDKNTLGAKVPVGTFEKLRGLAQAARHIQDVFSEKSEDEFIDPKTQANTPAKKVIGEGVLSVRHLIPILEKWKRDGFRNELDDYIFEDFVSRSSGARPKEKLYLYQVLQAVSDGQIFGRSGGYEWPAANSLAGAQLIDRMSRGVQYDLHSGKEKLKERLNIEYRFYPPQEVVEELFGPAPKRQGVDRRLLMEEGATVGMGNLSLEDRMQIERELSGLYAEIQQLANGILQGGFDLTEEERGVFKNFAENNN